MDLSYGELLDALKQLGCSIYPSIEVEDDIHGHLYEMAATAALIKSYDFCKKAAEEQQEQSFFLLPVLRGICEDFIVLKFLLEQAEHVRDEVIRLRVLEEAQQSAVAQWNFFKENRPRQKLYYRDSFNQELVEVRESVKKLLPHHPIKKHASMPSIHYMAEKVGALPLYQYVYHATSQFVHFSPRQLLRMGWAGPPTFTIATANFGEYYKHFSVFYGTFLLILLFELLPKVNGSAVLESSPVALALLKDHLQNTARWPELVTFEEMNIGSLSRMLFFKAPSEA